MIRMLPNGLVQLGYRIVRWSWRWRTSVTVGVRVVVRNTAGQVLLVRPGYAHGWAFPGGGVEKFEVPVHAAARELHEESGISVALERFRLVGVYANFREGKSDTVIAYALSDVDGTPRPDGSEIVDAAWFDEGDLPSDAFRSVAARLAELRGDCPLSDMW